MTLHVGDRAPEVVFGSRDGPVQLSELWGKGMVVVAFLRHFG